MAQVAPEQAPGRMRAGAGRYPQPVALPALLGAQVDHEGLDIGGCAVSGRQVNERAPGRLGSLLGPEVRAGRSSCPGRQLWFSSRVGEVSIQDRLYPQTACFGCGPSNPKGLRLKSYARDGLVAASFLPWPEHDNGVGFLNGGIISTVLDCHSAAAVMNEAIERGWPPLPGTTLAYVTAGLDVRFLRPAPLGEPVELRAVLTAVSEAEMRCAVELLFDGKQRATAEATWKRWRPR